jgi:hypothetical protein
LREHKLQVADPDGATSNDAKARVREHRLNVLDRYVAVAVKVRQEAMPGLGPPEIDNEDPPAWLQDSSNFASGLLACVSWQMVQHQRTEHEIESSICKRQLFRGSQLEHDSDASFCGFTARPRNHFCRGVDPRD